jgi:arylsulfatase A-like enzyme/lysophospholipase L1-like esterase
MKIAIQFCFAVLLTFTTVAESRRPNIVFILADDLGYGDLSCYGQQKFKTPNIDRLAAEGMKFTAHYAGNNVCAPSRCTLMSGKHPGHAYIRNNRGGIGQGGEGQEPVPAGELKLPLTLKQLGYTLGGFGKWGLGPVGSTGDPNGQGFDLFYGYNCQAVAHNYYPTHLWSNDTRIVLNNPKFAAHRKLSADADLDSPASYAKFAGNDFAPDLIGKQALKFIRENKERPFFLYYPTTVPHLALQVPDDSLKEFEGRFPEKPYPGGRGYLPHRTPRAAYAGMITRMDREVGRVLDAIKELGLDENTFFVFTSDNGPLFSEHGGTDTEFFNSAAGFRGRKGSFYEGGFRVPCLVRWKGKIAPGTTSDRVTGFEDWLPTLLELIGAKAQTPGGIDGISFARTLRGEKQEARPFLYRESPGYGGQQCVRVDDWKLVRQNLNAAPNVAKRPTTELYNLATDPNETTDVAAQNPDVVKRLSAIAREQRVPAKLWPIRALDNAEPAPPPAKAVRVSDFSDSDGNPAMRPIPDDPKLPRVLLIGDSISIGYTLEVRKLLAGKANVHRIPMNGGPTTRGVEQLDKWLGTGRWDVVHFNWGLHDLKIMTNGEHQVELAQYEANLRQLVKKLKASGAKLIWASTTPVPDGKLNPPRHPVDVVRFNEAALRVMKESGVTVNDLYAFALPLLSEIQLPSNVHFKPEGSVELAKPVADAIAAALAERRQ